MGRIFIRGFAVVMMLVAVARAQGPYPAVAAYLGTGSPVVWSPWTSAAAFGALAYTPPQSVALYCQASAAAPWTPCAPGGGGGSGTVTSIATTSPIVGGTITTSGTISCPTCMTGSAGSGFALAAYQLGSTRVLGPANVATDPTEKHLWVPGVYNGCPDSSGSGTTQVCTFGNTTTPVVGSQITYSTTTTNTGDVTVNVNSLGAVHIRKWLGTSVLASGDLVANVPVTLTYDGTYWEIPTIGNAPGAGAGTVTSVGFTGGLISVANPTTTPAFTVAGTSGGVPYFSSASTWASSAALTVNVLVKGGGAGAAPSNSSITDNATTVTTTDTGGWVGPTFTTNGTTAGFFDFGQGSSSAAVAPCNVANSICVQAPTSVTAYLLTLPGAQPTAGNLSWNCTAANPSVCSWQGETVLRGTLTLTTATTDSATITGVTSSSNCTFSPTNSTAAAATTVPFVSSVSTNTVVIGHVATTASGGTLNIHCTVN